MESELVIHIGMHKAGSSSIQKFLADNQYVLQRHGYVYADYNNSFSSDRYEESGKYINGMMHAFLHGKMREEDTIEKRKWDAFLTKLEEDLSKGNVILSDEAIFGRPIGKEYLICLKNLFGKYNIKCVVYLRRQDMHMESQRAYIIKTNSIINKNVSMMSMKEYYGHVLNSKVGFPVYKYSTYLKGFEEIVGRENVAVYVYEDACKYGLCRHFAEQVLKVHYKEFQEKGRINVSLAPMDTEVKRKLNNTFWYYPDTIKKSVNCLYKEMGLTYGNERVSQLSPKDRRKILDFYEEENKAVAKRYLNRETLFSEKVDYSYVEVEEDEVSKNYQNLLERMIARMVNEYMYPFARNILKKGKQIVLFGAGDMCQRVMHEQKIPIEFIVDNNKEKDGIQVGGITVVWSGNVKEWNKYFYLITPKDAHEIVLQLENEGLKYGEDFMQIKWETRMTLEENQDA